MLKIHRGDFHAERAIAGNGDPPCLFADYDTDGISDLTHTQSRTMTQTEEAVVLHT